MANTAADLPLELFDASKKYSTIAYIRETQLPARIRRKLLQDWATAVGVELTATDYELVTNEVKL